MTESDLDAHKRELLAFVEAVGCREDMIASLETESWTDQIVDAMLWQDLDLVLNGKDYSRQAENALRDQPEDVYGGYGWFHSIEPGLTEEDIRRTISWLRNSDEGGL